MRFAKINLKPSITIFEKDATLGVGIAYRSQCDTIIINTSVHTMSVREDDLLDFQRWLDHHYSRSKMQQDIPRSVYGLYLEKRMKQCLHDLMNIGCEVVVRYSKVEKVEIEQCYILTSLGNRECFSVCIIATGGEISVPENIDLETKNNALTIFEEEKISAIEKNSNIAIMGSAQSAIDACLLIDKYSSNCRYTLISRNGILPRVKSRYGCKANFNHQKFKFYDHTPHGLCSEILKSIAWKKRDFTSFRAQSFRSMEIDLRRATKHLPSWQSSMIALTPYINNLWFYLSNEDKHTLSQRWQMNLHTLRSAIMPESAARFLSIYRSGRIGMLFGNYTIINQHANFFLRNDKAIMRFNYIINATGIKARAHINLLRDEIAKKNISINPQDGFCVDADTMGVIGKYGKVCYGLYAIGYPTQGSVLISNSVELLRQQAVKIAKSIVSHLFE